MALIALACQMYRTLTAEGHMGHTKPALHFIDSHTDTTRDT
jgi:hypothetical protein